MLVAEVRYLGSWLAIVAAILVPLFGSVAIARAAHLSYWAGFALFLALLCGGAYAALTLWLRSVRNRSSTKPAEPAARPARFAPFVLSLVVLIFQAYWITTSFLAFENSRWTHDGDLFSLACIMTASSTFFTVREWRSNAANRSGPAPLSPYTQQRLARLNAAHVQPTKAARSKALRPLRVRGSIRLALLPLEAVLLFSLAPRLGILLALVSSFTIVAGIFLIGYKLFDL